MVRLGRGGTQLFVARRQEGRDAQLYIDSCVAAQRLLYGFGYGRISDGNISGADIASLVSGDSVYCCVVDFIRNGYELGDDGDFDPDGDSDCLCTRWEQLRADDDDKPRGGVRRGDIRGPLFADFRYDDYQFDGQRLQSHKARSHSTSL